MLTGAEARRVPRLLLTFMVVILCDNLQLHLGQKFLHVGLLGQQGAFLADGTGGAGHGIAEHIGGIQALAESIAHTGHHGIAGARSDP